MVSRIQNAVLFLASLTVSAVVLLAASNSGAATIYIETLPGNGETRAVTIRNIVAPQSGRYLLTLKNGTTGPRLVETMRNRRFGRRKTSVSIRQPDRENRSRFFARSRRDRSYQRRSNSKSTRAK